MFHVTSDSTLSISINGSDLTKLGSEDPVWNAHLIATNLVAALNLATVGYFWVDAGPYMPRIYRVREVGQPGEVKMVALFDPPRIQFPSRGDLTERHVHDTVLMFGQLTADKDTQFIGGYMKGLHHMSASMPGIDFYREAFFNFYRCVEVVVTRRILKAEKLQNELKDIQRAIGSIGAAADLVDAFKEVYALRGEQVAHAQREQRSVTFDDVLKVKAFADLLIHKTFRAEAEAWRAVHLALQKPAQP